MLRDLVSAMAWLCVILPIAAGLYGLWSLVHPPVRLRGDRLRAVGCSGIMGIVVGATIGSFGYLLARGMTTPPPTLFDALVLAVPIAGLFALAGLGGYAFLARRTDDAGALVGVVLGPAILIGVPLMLASTLGRASGN